jgi:hypothetical protein
LTTSFFNGTVVPPEINSTDELIDELTAQVVTVTASASEATAAAIQSTAAASNAAISEANVAILAQQANDTLAQANTAISVANTAASTATAAASTATTKAAEASSAATSANTSASNASASESAVAASATTATTQAGIATTQAGIATTQAAAALASKNAAGTSESNAAGSASTATTQAGIATTQAGTATTQAGIATTQAGTATTQAGNASTSAAAALASQNAAAASALLTTNQTAYLAGRNRTINGCCRIQQKASIVINSGTPSGYGGVDRFWAMLFGSPGGQFTQSAGTMTYGGISRPAVVQTVNTVLTTAGTTNGWLGITQVYEGANVYDLLGGPATISFLFNSNVTGQFSVALRDGANNNSFVSTFNAVANTPKAVVIPVSSLGTGLSVANNSSAGLYLSIGALNTATYQAATLNAWQASNRITASGNTNWASTINNFISVSELQLEAGSVATPFLRRPVDQELTLCQRYYRVISFAIGAAVQCVVTGAASAYSFNTFDRPMRSTPSGVITGSGFGVAGAAGTWNTGGSLACLSANQWYATIAGTSGVTGQAGYFNFPSAGAFTFNAEL